jgi:hypothetical protein
MSEIVPTKDRVAWYVLSADDAKAINKSLHVGKSVAEGDICPAMVVETFGDKPDSYVNLKVILGGGENFWATSRKVGAGPGTYHWTPYHWTP